MGKETKVGLLVGVVFIVLFGVILGGRVGSAAGNHAPLPVGDSGDHQVIVDTILGADDPLGPVGGMLTMDEASPVRSDQSGADPAEEPMPAPGDGESGASEPAEAKPTGRLAFGPVRVETPMPAPGPAETPAPQEETEVAETGEAPAPRPSAAAERPVHCVAKGETLTAIARRYYGPGEARLWRRIWEANKNRLPDPDRLTCGQRLVIPGLPIEMAPAETAVAEADDSGEAEAPAAGGEAVAQAEAPAAGGEAGVEAEAADEPGSEPSVTLEDLARRFRVRLEEDEGAGDTPEAPPTYTVREGDTFYRIARKVYGDASLTGKLARKNRDRVPDARRLRVGQKILLLERERTAEAAEAAEATVGQGARVARVTGR